MAVNIESILCQAIAQDDDRYVFGAEASKYNPDPEWWDCSELVEWACARANLSPTMPDGAYNQWRHCKSKSTMITVATGMKKRGALLFVGDGTGTGRDAITHVAFSLGDGTTIEARGSKWGVGCWPSAGRFNFAATIPGAAYTRPAVSPTKIPYARPVIKRGSKGTHVLYLQNVLKANKFKGKDGRIIVADGVFGANTEYVVKAIQAYCKLTPDGIVGPNTWPIIDGLAR